MSARSVCVRGIFATAVFLAAYPVGALTISGVTIDLGGSNTLDDTSSGSKGNTSETTIVSPGGTVTDALAASMSAKTRYASNLWADNVAADTVVTTTNSYDMSLSVSAGAGTTYDIIIDSLFSGAIQTVDECFLCFGKGAASVSAVEVVINSAVSVPHATSEQLIALGYYSHVVEFSETGTSSLTGLSGTTNLIFNVTWTSTAHTAYDEAGVLLGQDEAGAPAGVIASAYASLVPPRDMNDDGHFLTITANVTSVIPEPSTALLLATGLAILAARRRRG